MPNYSYEYFKKHLKCEPVDLVRHPNWNLQQAQKEYKELMTLYKQYKPLNKHLSTEEFDKEFYKKHVKHLVYFGKNISGISGGGTHSNIEILDEMNYSATKLDKL